MSNETFFGRTNELERIETLWQHNDGKMVIIKGRRRIGKSSLLDVFADRAGCSEVKKTYLKFEGLQPEDPKSKLANPQQKQITNLYTQLKILLDRPLEEGITDWSYFFDSLSKNIPKDRKTIIVFDEISWICEGEENLFLSKLKIFLDSIKRKRNVLIFLCGSSSVWIDKYITRSTAFVGRRDDTIILSELELNEISHFWDTKPHVSNKDKLKSILVTGGVPKYLELILTGESAESNIKRLCFNKGAFLFDEFETLFKDSFEKRSKYHKDILYILKQKPKNFLEIVEDLIKIKKVKKADIIKETENLKNHLGEYLSDLELSGFITKEAMYKIGGGLSKFVLYRISDCYTRFYLFYIEPKKGLIERDHFKFTRSLEFLPQYETIMGYQFENLVLNNKKIVLEKINIQNTKTFGPYRQYETSKQEACQIDLLIEDHFQTLYLCEIKFKKKITKQVISEVKEKIRKLKTPKGYSVRPILIYSGTITQDVIDSGYFDKIINIEDCLNINTIKKG